MSSYPALAGLRIGCVRYLNSVPLIFDYAGPVWFAHPAELARAMAGDQLDAALVPIFGAFGAQPYTLVDGVAIASLGTVYSVYLAYQGQLSDVRTVRLDPASLTSVHLLQVLLAEFHGIKLRCIPEASGEPAEGRLLIGNQAIEFRQQPGAEEWQYLDLGEEWLKQTGLPFVFAAWLLRPDLAEKKRVACDFRRLKEAGIERLEEILLLQEQQGNAFARTYLTEHIRFSMGAKEREAILLFRELAHRHGFVADTAREMEFV